MYPIAKNKYNNYKKVISVINNMAHKIQLKY